MLKRLWRVLKENATYSILEQQFRENGGNPNDPVIREQLKALLNSEATPVTEEEIAEANEAIRRGKNREAGN